MLIYRVLRHRKSFRPLLLSFLKTPWIPDYGYDNNNKDNNDYLLGLNSAESS